MRYPFKPSFSRAMALLGLLGLGLAQVGCAHPVVVQPLVSVHSRIGHLPVYTQVGVPGPVIYAPPPRVIYAPPPPPRVVYVPRVSAPVYGWGHGHDSRQRGQERRHNRHDDREYGRGGWDQRQDGRHDGRYDGRR
jgi:hypothetical protein